MKSLNPLFRNGYFLLAALIAAGIVHICTTLAIIYKGEVTGYIRLADKLPVNKITYLPEITPHNQILPFMMPDISYAACRFDASDGMVRIRAEITEPGSNLSMYAPDGTNFLFVPGKKDGVRKLNIVINTAARMFRTNSIDQPIRKESPIIKIKRQRGIAIFRAPINAIAFRRLAEKQLNSFECYKE